MDQTSFVDFNVNNDGNWHSVYRVMATLCGLISQIRFHVIPDSESLERTEYRCLNAASGNTGNEVLISNTAIPTIELCIMRKNEPMCGRVTR